MSDVLQFRGTHYDFGVQQGKLLKQSALMQNRANMYKRLTQKFSVDLPAIESLLAKFAPCITQEIQGLAHTLHLDLETAFFHFGGYYATPKSGCSIIIQSDYMIRNYDNAPDTYDGRYVLYAPSDGGYATLGPTMQVTGRMDGMNEKGLVMGYNFVNSKNSADGFVCNMIGRIVLEQCANVVEAVALLKQIPHKHAFNYCLLDQSGASIIVEASPRQVTTRTSTACTNHFHALTEENRYRMEDSVAREKLIVNAQQPHSKQAFTLMNNVARGVFATKYGAWDGTIHTAAYYPQSLKTSIALGGDTIPVPIDFGKWLAGERLAISKLKGQLDAKVGFAGEISRLTQKNPVAKD